MNDEQAREPRHPAFQDEDIEVEDILEGLEDDDFEDEDILEDEDGSLRASDAHVWFSDDPQWRGPDEARR